MYGRTPRFGRGPGRRGGPRVGRGDVRAALLTLLAEEPRNGYGIMQEIEQRSEGVWRPSPGSVYPALAQLEDEGLVRGETPDEGGKLFKITQAGTDELAQRGEQPAPWEAMAAGVSKGARDLHEGFRQLAQAYGQLASTGNEAQVAEASEALAEARKAIYRILAEG